MFLFSEEKDNLSSVHVHYNKSRIIKTANHVHEFEDDQFRGNRTSFRNTDSDG